MLPSNFCYFVLLLISIYNCNAAPSNDAQGAPERRLSHNDKAQLLTLMKPSLTDPDQLPKKAAVALTLAESPKENVGLADPQKYPKAPVALSDISDKKIIHAGLPDPAKYPKKTIHAGLPDPAKYPKKTIHAGLPDPEKYPKKTIHAGLPDPAKYPKKTIHAGLPDPEKYPKKTIHAGLPDPAKYPKKTIHAGLPDPAKYPRDPSKKLKELSNYDMAGQGVSQDNPHPAHEVMSSVLEMVKPGSEDNKKVLSSKHHGPVSLTDTGKVIHKKSQLTHKVLSKLLHAVRPSSGLHKPSVLHQVDGTAEDAAQHTALDELFMKHKPQKIGLEQSSIAAHWPLGVIPYRIDSESYDNILASRVRDQMDELESVSCLQFKRIVSLPSPGITENRTWIHFTNPKKERECSHIPIYTESGEVQVVLGLDCLKSRDIIHALLHAVGFKDEVSHPHRGQYIRIMWENIQPKYRKLFAITTDAKFIAEYDPMSVMHFHDRAFSKNGQATIAPLVPGLQVKPSHKLSQLDKMKLRMAFGHECNRRKVDEIMDTCKNVLHEEAKKEEKAVEGNESDHDGSHKNNVAIENDDEKDKVTAENDVDRKDKVTAENDDDAKEKVTAENDDDKKDKVTAENDDDKKDKVTAENDDEKKDKVTAENDDDKKDKVTAENDDDKKDKVTAENDDEKKDKVTAENDDERKDKVTAENDDDRKDRVTAENDDDAKEKVTAENDDKMIHSKRALKIHKNKKSKRYG